MNSIQIEGAERAMAAGAWCQKHINNKWEINMSQLGPTPRYDFVFADSTEATLFALKWR